MSDYLHASEILKAASQGMTIQEWLPLATYWANTKCYLPNLTVEQINNPSRFRVRPNVVEVEIWEKSDGKIEICIPPFDNRLPGADWTLIKTTEVVI